MKLYDAIKEIVKLKGKNIITDSALLNYLNDYHAFEERPASKLVLRDIINGGYSDKILLLNNKESSWTLKLKSYEHDFVDSCGYKEELVLYVFQSMAYAINLTDKKPGEGMDEVLDFHPFFDDEEQQITPTSTPSPKQKVDTVDGNDYLKIAQDFVDNGKLDTARSIAEKIINGSLRNDGNTIKATIMLGHIMRKKGFYKEAIYYYNQALNSEASILNVEPKELQQRISNREIKDFEDLDIYYMFCLFCNGQIEKGRWKDFIRKKAAQGNVVAVVYCAKHNIDPQRHIDIFFNDWSKVQRDDYLYADGSFAHERSKRKSIVGKVISKSTSDIERSKGWTHGRIMAYSDSNYGECGYPKAKWGAKKDFPFPHTHYSSDDLSHLYDIRPQLFSELLIDNMNNDRTNAFSVAKSWHVPIPLPNTSGWYLPNIFQLRQCSPYIFGSDLKFYFWSSTQVDKDNALPVKFYTDEDFDLHMYSLIYPEDKNDEYHIIPIFSF